MGEPAVTLSSSFPYADTSLPGTARIVTEEVGKPLLRVGGGIRDRCVGEDRLVMEEEDGVADGAAAAGVVLLLELSTTVFGMFVGMLDGG